MGQLRRLWRLLPALILAGCVLTSPPMIKPESAVEVPALAGRWEIPGGGYVFIRASPDNSYVLGHTEDADVASKMDSVGRAVPLKGRRYLLEEVQHNEKVDQKSGQLALIQVYGNYLAFFSPPVDDIAAAARKAGLQLTIDKTSAWGSTVQVEPGQSEATLIETYKSLVDVGLEHAVILSRVGGYTEEDWLTASVQSMTKLMNSGQPSKAIEMARYLSNRGSYKAQLELLNWANAGKISRDEGIFHGLRAMSAEMNGLEADLARLYATPATPGVPISKEDGREGLYWLSMANYVIPPGLIDELLDTLLSAVCGRPAQGKTFESCAEDEHFIADIATVLHAKAYLKVDEAYKKSIKELKTKK